MVRLEIDFAVIVMIFVLIGASFSIGVYYGYNKGLAFGVIKGENNVNYGENVSFAVSPSYLPPVTIHNIWKQDNKTVFNLSANPPCSSWRGLG